MKVIWYAVGPDTQVERGPTLMEARAAARRGGGGWTVASRKEPQG